jgi:hypothetical protein
MHPVLSREQAPADSESSTRQTVERMAQHVRAAAGDPAVIWAAHEALRTAGGPGSSQRARCQAVFFWIKAHVRFRTDDALISQLFGEQDQLELLISPPVLLRAASPAGDCDDFTMLCCAMLNELGVPNRICTVKADQPDPDRWSHVYCCAGGMALDTSHGDFPGWEVPHFYEKRYWDSGTGQAIATEAGSVPKPALPDSFRPPAFASTSGFAGIGWFGGTRQRAAAGLHGLTRRGTPHPTPGRRRGMGDDTCYDSNGNPYDCSMGAAATITPVDISTGVAPPGPTGGTVSDVFGNTASTVAGLPTAGQSSPASYSTPISTTGLAQMLNSGFATLQLALSPAGSVLVQNPNGSYTIQQPNSAGLTASSMSSLLWIGGAVVAVIVVASVLKK